MICQCPQITEWIIITKTIWRGTKRIQKKEKILKLNLTSLLTSKMGWLGQPTSTTLLEQGAFSEVQPRLSQGPPYSQHVLQPPNGQRDHLYHLLEGPACHGLFFKLDSKCLEMNSKPIVQRVSTISNSSNNDQKKDAKHSRYILGETSPYEFFHHTKLAWR